MLILVLSIFELLVILWIGGASIRAICANIIWLCLFRATGVPFSTAVCWLSTIAHLYVITPEVIRRFLFQGISKGQLFIRRLAARLGRCCGNADQLICRDICLRLLVDVTWTGSLLVAALGIGVICFALVAVIYTSGAVIRGGLSSAKVTIVVGVVLLLVWGLNYVLVNNWAGFIILRQ